jgi:hypothetical protein
MPNKEKLLNTSAIDIYERRITLEDGRYMVFFTFTDDAGKDLSEGLHPWTSEVSSSGERTTPSGPIEPGQPPLLSATPRGDAPAGTPGKEGS